MKTLYKLLFCFILSPSFLYGQNIDSLLTQYAQNGKNNGIRSNFNGVVLVATGDNIVFNKSYGYANFQTKNTLTPDSKFLVGSVTKPIVAFLVMKQVELGTIKLDQSVLDFLPYLDFDKNKDITIHHLLSHTSGLSHYNGIRPFFKSRDDFFYAKMSPKEYAQLIDRAQLECMTGTSYNYSSLGYVLLGAILEEVTGQSFSDLIKTTISKPLELHNFGFETNTYLDSNIVKSYQFRKGVYKLLPNRDQSNTYSTGGIHANAKDLFKWTQGLRAHMLLSKETTQKMLEPNLEGYAYGWIRNDSEILRYIPHARFYGHGGRVNGYSSYVMLNDDGTTIIILANTLPIQPWKLISDIYRYYKKEDLQLSTRVILPSLRSIERFNEEGGLKGVLNYKEQLSESAGYPIYPSASYLSKFLKQFHSHFKAEELDVLMAEMINGNPNGEDVINRIAYDYIHIDISKAETYFKRAVKLFPNSPNAWDSYGEFYEETGVSSKAYEGYSRAVQLAKQYHLKNLYAYEENLKRVKK